MRQCGMPHCFVNEMRERIYWFKNSIDCERFAKK